MRLAEPKDTTFLNISFFKHSSFFSIISVLFVLSFYNLFNFSVAKPTHKCDPSSTGCETRGTHSAAVIFRACVSISFPFILS